MSGTTPDTGKIHAAFSRVPLLGWLLGILAAVILEKFFGTDLAMAVGLPKIPALFGIDIMLKKPLLVPNAFLYTLLIYALPVGAVAVSSASLTNRAAAALIRLPIAVPVAVHLGLFYLSMHFWAEVSDYRALVLKLTLIAIMLTLSLNVINGYMGEFSCSHPGFMALGAYCALVVTVGLFVDGGMFGISLLPESLGPFLFPLALVAGGLLAAVGALLVAVPSFRTRGDYLAIISLAFLFIVKSLIENFEFVRGPRGMSGQPDWAGLFTVFLWTVICVWSINNFVRSTLGKALNAVRDNELAANAMTVDTRRTKMIGFLFAAFWAGVAGGLFAHVLRYVNPGTFGIQNLAEVLAMVYFGGLNSVYGSIVGAVSISLLGEALRPLEIFKWIIIPLLLILVMIYRPTGLI
ncbi:MAG: inner-rane translocator, partial [candidate division NC10 bacterium]|nr:inner-rane translocator [candidate division NC10 bacterium]